jgi:hypothetical protein
VFVEDWRRRQGDEIKKSLREAGYYWDTIHIA